RFNGEPVAPDQRFIVATNNYRAAGGGSFPHLDGSNIIIEAPDTNRDVIVRFIIEQGTIDPSADGNWRLAPIPGEVELTFESSPAAAAYLDGETDIELLEQLDTGFAEYALDLGG